MTLQEYLGSLRNKTVAVIGIGVSNTPLLRLLLANGIDVTACDKRERDDLGALADELEREGAKLQLGEDYLEGLDQDVIFRTPGMRPDVPQLLRAKEQGSVITSEMEVFFDVCPCSIIAVTGSDGKTTTTTMIAELLRAAGRTVHVGGNIGNPLLAQAGEMNPDDSVVLELSSFQLMTMQKSPHIAVVTNLSPNHLDMHKGMEEYVASKENLFIHQSAADIAIFNLDNDITREQGTRAVGEVRYFTRHAETENGVFLRGDEIIRRKNGKESVVMTVQDIKLPGIHNVENYMAAIAAVEDLVEDETIRQFARTFGGVEHRIELVRTLRGVRYYNDSIASSPSRTIAGLRSFKEKVILIAGGYDKKIPFDVLGPEVVEHVKLLILCGATAEKIRDAVVNAPEYQPGKPEILMVSPFQKAVETARDRAEEGDVVTLSPACAAFDQFKNFMERGKTYKAIVNSWE
ncbi:MAG: UDP-N-acetylmuramoyl-L-alanine--D-glutamate ligase [Oscillospiraceae bacterium]|nr:UDP-N-acetylmuramoyl-L-alanine--D-glutamate ligase [Oscillospiraceae bacterium]